MAADDDDEGLSSFSPSIVPRVRLLGWECRPRTILGKRNALMGLEEDVDDEEAAGAACS